MVRNLNTRSKARLEDTERSRRYCMICANRIVHLRTHVERDCVSRVDKGRLNIARHVATPTSHPLLSFSLPALSAIVLPTDHVFVFLLSYPVRDCTPYHPCTLISLIVLHLSFHFHCPCTSISLVRKDASHPHRLGPCRANK